MSNSVNLFELVGFDIIS